ncbi:MAG: amidohydrolase family protein [Polyangiaceae bacterium]
MRCHFLPVLVLLTACADNTVHVGGTPGSSDGGTIDADVLETGVAETGGFDSAPPPATPILLTGTIVTPDTVFDGQVLIVGANIACAAAGTACASDPAAMNAKVIDTGGIIVPGMIDSHNHILFDIFDNDDWLPAMVYQDHTQWTTEAKYTAMLDVKQCLDNDSQGKPTWCAATPYGTAAGNVKCEMDKWGELKGLVAGTTSIVGLAGTTAQCFGSLTRSIDASQNGLGVDHIRTSALFPPSKATADSVCASFSAGTTDAFLIHVGEGTNAKALGEFAKLGTASTTAGCLYAPQTTITHGTAFTAAEFGMMATSKMSLTWSPASNVALYGATANIPAALDAGLTVALAPDWSMGGSQNLLDEMRFADAWDNAHFSDRLKPKDLVLMTTSNAAAVIGLGDRLGQIKKGYVADLFVVSGNVALPYDAILAATPKEVKLVMIGGQVLFGDAPLVNGAPIVPAGCETIDVCGASKVACVATATHTDKLDQTFAQIKGALEQALLDSDQQTLADGYTFAPLSPLYKCP